MKKVVINREIFDKFPDFKRGIIIIRNIENNIFNDKIEILLNREIVEKSGKGLAQNDLVKIWEEAYLKFGANPNKFPPSIKSLAKRIDAGGKIPFINSVVALFNYISIKYLIPCGGDDFDRIEGNAKLGLANGAEQFVPLGGTESENPVPGEIIYFDDKTLKVMCRRWNWRNGDFTKITEKTKQMVINLDGLLPGEGYIEKARDELAKLLVEYCGAQLSLDCLDKDRTEIEVF